MRLLVAYVSRSREKYSRALLRRESARERWFEGPIQSLQNPPAPLGQVLLLDFETSKKREYDVLLFRDVLLLVFDGARDACELLRVRIKHQFQSVHRTTRNCPSVERQGQAGQLSPRL